VARKHKHAQAQGCRVPPPISSTPAVGGAQRDPHPFPPAHQRAPIRQAPPRLDTVPHTGLAYCDRAATRQTPGHGRKGCSCRALLLATAPQAIVMCVWGGSHSPKAARQRPRCSTPRLQPLCRDAPPPAPPRRNSPGRSAVYPCAGTRRHICVWVVTI